MKRILNILLAAAATLSLAACTVDATDPDNQPTTTPTDQGRKLSFGFPAPPVTYGTVEALLNEKLIYQVAVFIETENALLKFFSTEADGSALGFHKVISDRVGSQPENIQTRMAGVTVDLPHDVGEITNIAVIGNYNYPEDSYTDRLKAIGSWDELKAFRVPVGGAGLLHNLSTRQGLLSTKVFTPAEIAKLMRDDYIEVALDRNAARIHIDPMVSLQVAGVQQGILRFDWDANVFKTVKLVIYNPKKGTYLLPQLASKADRTEIEQHDRWVFEGIGDRMTGGYWYFYEMTGDEAEQMEIYVIYKYRANTATDVWEEGYAGGRVTLDNGSEDCILRPNATYEFTIPMIVDVDYVADADWSDWLVP